MNERELYRSQVALLIRIMPSVYRIKDFAVHGGTAINLFYRNLPRYSVDIESHTYLYWAVKRVCAISISI